MVSEYRFLRFEIAGLVTVAFYAIIAFPVVLPSVPAFSNLDLSLALVATLFLISLPLGYWEHQLVVNKYRSADKPRTIHGLLNDVLAEEAKSATGPLFKQNLQNLSSPRQNAFLTTFAELCIYSDEIKMDSAVFDRLSDRWSHFYARKAVAVYAPILSTIFAGATFVWGTLSSWNLNLYNIWISILLALIIYAINYKAV